MSQFNKYFSGLVGQSRTVERITNQLVAMANGKPGKSVFITGRTGLGKDEMTNRIARAMSEGLGMNLHSFACPSEITGKPYSKICEDLDSGNPTVIHIGEAHRLKLARVQLTRLRQFIMMWTDKQNIGKEISINNGELRGTVNWKNAVFILNTNFPSKLEEGKQSTSFRDRFLFDELEDYSEKEIFSILTAMIQSKGLRIADDTLSLIVHCARGTARPLANITDELVAMASVGEKTTLNRKEVINAIRLAKMFPKGLQAHEVETLQVCATPRRQGDLEALFPNLEASDLRKSMAYLMNCHQTKKGERAGFLERSTGGFKTSVFGLRYLETIKSEGFKLPG